MLAEVYTSKTLDVAVIRVTYQMAEEWLESSHKKNRALTVTRVDKYATS